MSKETEREEFIRLLDVAMADRVRQIASLSARGGGWIESAEFTKLAEDVIAIQRCKMLLRKQWKSESSGHNSATLDSPSK